MIRKATAAIVTVALLLCLSVSGLAAAEAQTEAAPRGIEININNVNVNVNGQRWDASGPMSVGYLQSGLYAPYGALYVVDSSGYQRPYDAPLATGDSVIWYDEAGNRRTTEMVVKGDVLGTGVINIAQLVRLAQALNGNWPLYGVYRIAGDLNGNGYIDIGDLVAEAELLW